MPNFWWSSLKLKIGYSIIINAKFFGKVYPKGPTPFWKRQTPFSDSLVALCSHIYFLGGRTYSHESIRDMSKLRFTPCVGILPSKFRLFNMLQVS
jgi:hypothetical protein